LWKHLGYDKAYYLNVDVYSTGFGGVNQQNQFMIVQAGYVEGCKVATTETNSAGQTFDLSNTAECKKLHTIVQKCSPGLVCSKSFDRCSNGTNIDVTHLIQPQFGGSLMIVAHTEGVQFFASTCLYECDKSIPLPTPPAVPEYQCDASSGTGYALWVKYTLQANHKMPTFLPTLAPAGVAVDTSHLAIDALQVIMGGGTPFYVIIVVSLGYCALAVKLLNLRKKAKKMTREELEETQIRERESQADFEIVKIVRLRLGKSIQEMLLLGSGLISEFYLLFVLLSSSTYREIGYIILSARASHALMTFYILLRILGPSSISSTYANLLDHQHLIDFSQYYGLVEFLALFDSSLMRYMPWKVFLKTFWHVSCNGYRNHHITSTHHHNHNHSHIHTHTQTHQNIHGTRKPSFRSDRKATHRCTYCGAAFTTRLPRVLPLFAAKDISFSRSTIL